MCLCDVLIQLIVNLNMLICFIATQPEVIYCSKFVFFHQSSKTLKGMTAAKRLRNYGAGKIIPVLFSEHHPLIVGDISFFLLLFIVLMFSKSAAAFRRTRQTFWWERLRNAWLLNQNAMVGCASTIFFVLIFEFLFSFVFFLQWLLLHDYINLEVLLAMFATFHILKKKKNTNNTNACDMGGQQWIESR